MRVSLESYNSTLINDNEFTTEGVAGWNIHSP